MVDILLKKFLIRGLERGEIILFPVWIIPFPIYKTGFRFLVENGNYFVHGWEIGATVQFPVWIILFPVCKIGFGLLSKNCKCFAKEVFSFNVWK